MKSGKKIVQKG